MADTLPDTLPDSVRARIAALDLVPHPEGGWYRETHRSPVVIPRAALPAGYPGDRRVVTSILFLLATGAPTRWHRVRSEELWFHHEGDLVELRTRCAEDGAVACARLGPGAVPQAIVPAGWWQAATVEPGPAGYALVGCVVAPGFEFEDFEVEGG